MKERRVRQYSMVLCFTVLFVTSGTYYGMAANSFAVRSAKMLIESNAEGILFAAYPTDTFTYVEYVGIKEYSNGGFKLRYAFHYEIDENCDYLALDFRFDSDGLLSYIQDPGYGIRCSLWPPFGSCGLIMIVLESAMCESQDAPPICEEPEFQRYFEQGDCKGMLELYLRSLQEQSQ